MENTELKKANERFLRALILLSNTADELSEIWNEHPNADFIGIEDYPLNMSFDDFAVELKKWKLTQIEIINGGN